MIITRLACALMLCFCTGYAEENTVSEPRSPADAGGYLTRQLKGWTVHVNRELNAAAPDASAKAMHLLETQLEQINQRVPEKALKALHAVPLWLNPLHAAGDVPRAEYHPSADWLQKHGRDPRMARAVEFTNVLVFEKECRRMPMFVLHELSHAYHDRVLGFQNKEVLEAFQNACARGVYNSVQQWNGTNTTKAKAYALSNAREYFAENSEAFFGRNDFQPFDRDELKAMDPKMHDLLFRVWGCGRDAESRTEPSSGRGSATN
jgi:hypothetical protein